MTRYLIYGESDRKPIRKTKHKNDALLFASDFRNLQRHGCMTVIREDDDGNRQRWNSEISAWENSEEIL